MMHAEGKQGERDRFREPESTQVDTHSLPIYIYVYKYIYIHTLSLIFQSYNSYMYMCV